METTLSVAKALYLMYEKKFGATMDEMKMHKLMYFAQRESFIREKCQLFGESFYGWKYGPVLTSVRHEYIKPKPFDDISESVSDGTLALIDGVLERYGKVSSWNLSMLSHEEISWKLSRTGLESSDNGERQLSVQAIQLDAIRESIARSSMKDKEKNGDYK